MAEKYIVIADKLEIELKKMRSEGRMKLPSENSLSEQFSCSRQTVRAALDILKRAGLIEKRNGSGSYIVEESKKNKTVYFITEDCDRYLSPALISGLRSELTSSKYALKAFSTIGSGKEEAAAISRAISEKAAAIIIDAGHFAAALPDRSVSGRLGGELFVLRAPASVIVDGDKIRFHRHSFDASNLSESDSCRMRQ